MSEETKAVKFIRLKDAFHEDYVPVGRNLVAKVLSVLKQEGNRIDITVVRITFLGDSYNKRAFNLEQGEFEKLTEGIRKVKGLYTTYDR